MRDRALERGLKQSSIVSSGTYAARATASGTPAFAFKTFGQGSGDVAFDDVAVDRSAPPP
jgi:hypothetical protein